MATDGERIDAAASDGPAPAAGSIPASPLQPLSMQAFERYCRDPVVQFALAATKGTIGIDLLRDCFMAGAKHAIERCKAAGHHRVRL